MIAKARMLTPQLWGLIEINVLRISIYKILGAYMYKYSCPLLWIVALEYSTKERTIKIYIIHSAGRKEGRKVGKSLPPGPP